MEQMDERDTAFLRAAIEVAERARATGNHPFGALLADRSGNVLLEAENTVITERDITGHAELNLVRAAAARYEPDVLAGCTLYASTEPCAMCASAIVWSGIGRVVFALSGARMVGLVADLPGTVTLDLPCREVFARSNRSIEVAGPALEAEAEQVHAGFWV
jgi:tRNA(Arg) A34 adenosine deaminase TadA